VTLLDAAAEPAPAVTTQREGEKRARRRANAPIVIGVLVFLVVGLALVSRGRPERVGDGGEYVAMAWQLSHLRAPSMTGAQLDQLHAHFRATEPRMAGFRDWSVRFPELVGDDGRQDFPHFWAFPLAAAPFELVARALGWPDTYSFLALNLLLATVAFVVIARRSSLWVSALILASPMLWWLDKAHGELFVFCLLALAVALREDRPGLAAMCFALAAAHNMSLLFACALFGAWLAVRHGRRLLRPPTSWALLAALAISAVHPLYYEVRLGTIDPQALYHAANLEVPSATKILTPLFDPNLGLLIWWPAFCAVVLVGILLSAAARVRARPDRVSFALGCISICTVVAALYGASTNNKPDSGGTFSLSRYAVWVAPLLLPCVFVVARRVTSRGWTGAAVTALVAASFLLSVNVARPSLRENYWSVHDTFVADAVFDHAPWLWNPMPQSFIARQRRQWDVVAPTANASCTKRLAVRGSWPDSCPSPSGVPPPCTGAPFCYANSVGRRTWFVPATHAG
jgi:hypothetical protein